MILTNLVSFVGQLDEHAPFLTVQETFDFAANCRTGVHKKQSTNEDQVLSENLTIEGLDLTICRDTFVGDANNRGVSGGQRRRVSVGEMLVGQSPVACADEISTGLDAAVTYDICHSMVRFAKVAGIEHPVLFAMHAKINWILTSQLLYHSQVQPV